MTITIDMIKQLREATAAGMGACKEALAATEGNMDEAVKYLREKGLAVAAKRVDKESKMGLVSLAEAADKKAMALAARRTASPRLMRTRSAARMRRRARSTERTSRRLFRTTTRCFSPRRART